MADHCLRSRHYVNVVVAGKRAMPQWLIMDDVLEGLEPETRERLLDVLGQIEGVTLIYIGRSEEFRAKFSPRLFHLSPLHAHTEKKKEEA